MPTAALAAGARLPRWTWVAPLPIFHLGTWLSVWFQIAPGTSLWYLPITLGFALVLWWGPRVLPALWLNAALSAGLWGLDQWWYWPLYALPETIEVGLCWLLFQHLARGRHDLPDLPQTIRFLVLGLAVPIVLGSLATQGLLLLLGDLGPGQWLAAMVSGGLSDLLGGLAVTVPLLVFASARMHRAGLAPAGDAVSLPWIPLGMRPGAVLGECALALALIAVLALTLPADAWLVFGLLVLWPAVRFGLPLALVITIGTVVLSLFIPDATVAITAAEGIVPRHLSLAILCAIALITGRAITSLHLAMAERQAINADLERRVAERTAELESFTYTVSHDLRSPLRTISSYASLLEMDAPDLAPEPRQHLQRIRGGARQMGSLIDALLTLSRVSRRPLQRRMVDLTSLARQVVADLQRDDPERRIAIEIADGLSAQADPDLIRDVITNLIGNAWKYTRKTSDPLIRVEPAMVDGRPGFSVSDNGVGFDDAYHDKLFKPFQRLHDVQEFEGLGIGLASVQRIIARHHGAVEASGSPGRGATFRFTFEPPVG